MTSSRKKGQPLKLEKMVKLRGTLLISRKRWKGLEEMTKTKINTEIRIEIEIGTGLRKERGIDPGTDQGKGGKIDPETGKEAVPMITERKWTNPETEAEKEGEAGPEIAIIEGIMARTSHPDTEEDLLVVKTLQLCT